MNNRIPLLLVVLISLALSFGVGVSIGVEKIKIFKYDGGNEIRKYGESILPTNASANCITGTSSDAHRFITINSDNKIDIKDKAQADQSVADFKNRIVANVSKLIYFSAVGDIYDETHTRGGSYQPPAYGDPKYRPQWFSGGEIETKTEPFPDNPNKEFLAIEAIYDRGNARGIAYLTMGQDRDTTLIICEWPR
jgi:hypothetical protein